MQQGVDRLFGPHLLYNTLDDTGAFEQPGFSMQRALPAHGSAEHMEFLGKDKYRFRNATFTTCSPAKEDWRLEAPRSACGRRSACADSSPCPPPLRNRARLRSGG